MNTYIFLTDDFIPSIVVQDSTFKRAFAKAKLAALWPDDYETFYITIKPTTIPMVYKPKALYSHQIRKHSPKKNEP